VDALADIGQGDIAGQRQAGLVEQLGPGSPERPADPREDIEAGASRQAAFETGQVAACVRSRRGWPAPPGSSPGRVASESGPARSGCR
jgi:hypothetical protein